MRNASVAQRRLARWIVAGSIPGVVTGAVLRTTWIADQDRFVPALALVLLAVGARLLTDGLVPGFLGTRASRDPADVPASRIVGLALISA